jgi:putative Mn2+ efflux pump MntP
MIEILLLAVALSMDAFAVSIGLGAKHKSNLIPTANTAGCYFGISQAFMPFLGYAFGILIFSWIEVYTKWIAFILLLLIGGKMIYESLHNDTKETEYTLKHRDMFVLAIATSIDAMAAGFSLSLININPLISCLIIGITSYIFSFFGVLIGAKGFSWLENKAEIFGGIILIVIGFKLLFL